VSLGVYWDRALVGRLQLVDERSREYGFEYVDDARPISISLPTTQKSFTPAEARPFFEALLPEGTLREEIAARLRIASGDSYGLLSALGRDCAGALQIADAERMSDPPSTRWMDAEGLDDLVEHLRDRPLGLRTEDGRARLSLAGVQRKAVLSRDRGGRFGEPLNGMPSTHILKPDSRDATYPEIATNEYFCMRLAERCGLRAAEVELISAAGRPCLVVTRFDRDPSENRPRRLHQEDLCQALGLTPDFKYQLPGWSQPSYGALAKVLDRHSVQPGFDRLAAAQAAVFHFLVGNADAHAKNVSLLHVPGGVRLAPLYDIVSTAAYPELSTELALAIGEERHPAAIGTGDWLDLAHDLGLAPAGFEAVRRRLAAAVVEHADSLRDRARKEGWHGPVIERIVTTIQTRIAHVA